MVSDGNVQSITNRRRCSQICKYQRGLKIAQCRIKCLERGNKEQPAGKTSDKNGSVAGPGVIPLCPVYPSYSFFSLKARKPERRGRSPIITYEVISHSRISLFVGCEDLLEEKKSVWKNMWEFLHKNISKVIFSRGR